MSPSNSHDPSATLRPENLEQPGNHRLLPFQHQIGVPLPHMTDTDSNQVNGNVMRPTIQFKSASSPNLPPGPVEPRFSPSINPLQGGSSFIRGPPPPPGPMPHNPVAYYIPSNQLPPSYSPNLNLPNINSSSSSPPRDFNSSNRPVLPHPVSDSSIRPRLPSFGNTQLPMYPPISDGNRIIPPLPNINPKQPPPMGIIPIHQQPRKISFVGHGSQLSISDLVTESSSLSGSISSGRSISNGENSLLRSTTNNTSDESRHSQDYGNDFSRNRDLDRHYDLKDARARKKRKSSRLSQEASPKQEVTELMTIPSHMSVYDIPAMNFAINEKKSGKTQKWTPEDDQLIIHYKEALNYSWKYISKLIGERHTWQAIQMRYLRCLKDRNANWNKEEEFKLIQILKDDWENRWKRISIALGPSFSSERCMNKIEDLARAIASKHDGTGEGEEVDAESESLLSDLNKESVELLVKYSQHGSHIFKDSKE